MPVPELAPDPGQRVLHCHVNWVKTHLHNNTIEKSGVWHALFINILVKTQNSFNHFASGLIVTSHTRSVDDQH